MTTETWLNRGTERLTTDELTMMVGDRDIKATGFWTHTKATENYVVVSIRDEGAWKEWYVPFVYRRTNTFIDTAQDLAEYIRSRKSFLSAKHIEAFKKSMKRQIKQLFGNQSTVTLPIFKKLLKETGFTLATKIEDQKTYHMLLPFGIVKAPTYETIPAKVRKAIFAALGNVDAYGDKPIDHSALPDHKFPEIRWTAETAESNEGLTEAEIRDKFQLVPEVVNQAKREVCRSCFQTGCRGKFAGIDFFYDGNDSWPSTVPTMGKDAEAGCVGCFWYDMAAWRKALNKFLKENKG